MGIYDWIGGLYVCTLLYSYRAEEQEKSDSSLLKELEWM